MSTQEPRLISAIVRVTKDGLGNYQFQWSGDCVDDCGNFDLAAISNDVSIYIGVAADPVGSVAFAAQPIFLCREKDVQPPNSCPSGPYPPVDNEFSGFSLTNQSTQLQFTSKNKNGKDYLYQLNFVDLNASNALFSLDPRISNYSDDATQISVTVTISKNGAGQYSYRWSGPNVDANGELDYSSIANDVTVLINVATNTEGLQVAFGAPCSQAIFLCRERDVPPNTCPSAPYNTNDREFRGFALNNDASQLRFTDKNKNGQNYLYRLNFIDVSAGDAHFSLDPQIINHGEK